MASLQKPINNIEFEFGKVLNDKWLYTCVQFLYILVYTGRSSAIEIYLDLSDVYTCFKVTGIQFAERKLGDKGTCECSNLPQRYFIESHTSHSTYTAPFRWAGGCAKGETKWK